MVPIVGLSLTLTTHNHSDTNIHVIPSSRTPRQDGYPGLWKFEPNEADAVGWAPAVVRLVPFARVFVFAAVRLVAFRRCRWLLLKTRGFYGHNFEAQRA
jgi:hypothetical protein